MVRPREALAVLANAEVVEFIAHVEAFVLKKLCTDCSQSFCCPESARTDAVTFHLLETCEVLLRA